MKTIIIDGIEYNLTPKVLFKKGDFVVIQETTYLISKIEGLNVTLSCNGRDCLFDIDVLKNARLWDITKDAKAGDVLATKSGGVFIYKEMLYGKPFAYCGVDKFGVFKDCKCGAGLDWTPYLSEVTPATREQRELLFQKMKEAGYKWDSGKEESKPIEPQPSQWNISDFRTWQYIVCDVLTKYNGIGQYLDDGRCKQIAKYMQENWSKNLIQPQNTWKPSDAQMNALDSTLQYSQVSHNSFEHLNSLFNDLKKLREK